MKDVQVRATTNPLDAPVVHFVFEDGSGQLRRDLSEPGRPWVRRTLMPHAVVIMDGELSWFDVANRRRN